MKKGKGSGNYIPVNLASLHHFGNEISKGVG